MQVNMKSMKYFFVWSIFITNAFVEYTYAQQLYHEQYRPQIHFTPKSKWMNDPNGMVFYKGVYHLFYQYYPDSTVWGPMHWAHATSTDLIHWQQQAIALYPDSLGYIFSGSAVVDKNNTSGFGKNGKVPLVAIFTHHDPVGAQAGRNDFQNQSLAYSLDEGKTWIKYAGNPVLKNPGIIDFRDPKVMWYEPQKKWVMTLATKDYLTFYSSPDLKNWAKESEFGKETGAHGGVWECPDLFTLSDNGKEVWVLIVNVNPGGPNKGSATQYFLGDFDGNKFTPSDTTTKWLDYGPDEYAGVTWSNTGDRRIFLGWMSNWLYANVVPTERWRSAMTLPRDLKLKHVGSTMLVASKPVSELHTIEAKPIIAENFRVAGNFDLSQKTGKINLPCRLNLNMEVLQNFSVALSNEMNEQVVIGYDKENSQYYIDRTKSGKADFYKGFAAKHMAPRFENVPQADLSLIIDVSSVELFADDGLTVMTEIFFPSKPFNQIHIQSPDGIAIKKLEYAPMNSIWK
jgi:fructan beta-fructosidase